MRNQLNLYGDAGFVCLRFFIHLLKRRQHTLSSGRAPNRSPWGWWFHESSCSPDAISDGDKPTSDCPASMNLLKCTVLDEQKTDGTTSDLIFIHVDLLGFNQVQFGTCHIHNALTSVRGRGTGGYWNGAGESSWGTPGDKTLHPAPRP